MKQVIITLIAVLTLTTAYGKNRVEIERDSLGNIQRIIELNDTAIGGKEISDTLSVTTYHGASGITFEDEKHQIDIDVEGLLSKQMDGIMDGFKGFVWISIITIISIFALPAIIIFLVLNYRSKKRKERYQVIEKAIESGQPLPEEFVEKTKEEDDAIRVKGIKNIFLGLGLAIFFYAMTDVFFLACIGLLIMFNGIGQLVIFYTRPRK